MAMAKRNQFNKALQAHMAKEKKFDAAAALEHAMACNTNPNRGKVFDQSEINRLYSRRGSDGATGATKVCHLYNHNGEKFKYIVVKRFKKWGHDFDKGNQLIEEIKAWEELHNTATADYLCPILKYFTSKSDKVSDSSETMKNNVVIIAQKAVYVSNAKCACLEAERLNRQNGYHGETAQSRYDGMREVAKAQHWWDAMGNGGNSGVVFDYSKNCYKAVFIDYAL